MVKKKKKSASQQKDCFVITRLMFFEEYVNPWNHRILSQGFTMMPRKKEKGMGLSPKGDGRLPEGDKVLNRADRGTQTPGDVESKFPGSSEGTST